MFRALCAHRQEGKILLYSLWYHHTCRWSSGAQVERGLLSQIVNSVYIFHTKRCVYCIWSGCLLVFLRSFHKCQMTVWVSSNIPCGMWSDWMSLLLLQLCQNATVCLCADCSANLHRLWQNQFWEPADLLHLLLSRQTLSCTAPRHRS
jgi:hypothetical protein